ncbi:prephenate dehydrogenase/arogenate dehydrogenase family protein [Candidatus Nitrosotalea okcheonensis]|uniref:Prephenate dehydrogenase n=1 Tax=Candidatus Nitrosotalea okcheonensis TaxID=1903276 RepID=A0A2H1FC37_9ARCH|nr:prephenate dehydrogenase/arogenate dehydrogenase family protein [Candidatus Nitrosotalea okcheonensis]MDE1728253.1 prephenate dehydrogenase/arogenate dehydrogenase family protein [Nitrososphaerota archaeon]MDE1831664.1 prephenate dehydrogenase/arogenate dehydrogenase family protein [Nitrososphaerota archaeon]MDE1841504.1 prephenate dehydrogenase/arogenate dehydrogenase family protein [Nitrososphaerota archaeon]SMH70317.1 Prephenate dehydrogenase [Candidatus Nitrosotalea okcheonensis]
MKKKIAIIGAEGQMGKWFSKYFLEKDYDIIGYDSEKEILNKSVTKAQSLVGAILTADYVILCIPVKRTPETIRLIAKEMKRDSYLIDISSLKTKTAAALSKIPDKVNPICIHPMFGPGTKKLKGQNIISIPIRDAKKEMAVTKSLFEEANFVQIDATEHDKKIAIVLGMPHLVNLALANIFAKEENFTLVEKMAGTTFKAQKLLTTGIMTEPQELIETIISNPEIRRYAEEFWKDIGRMLILIQENKTEEMIKYISSAKERLAKNVDLDEAYKKLVTMVSAVEK